MNVVEELRQARQHAGLSREDLSQRTNIPLALIEALEQHSFDRLPEGRYLDDTVRAYARTVGLEDDVMVQRMRTDRAIRVRRAADQAAIETTTPSTEFVYVTDETSGSADADLDSFPAESNVAFDLGPPHTSIPWDADLVVRDEAAPPIRARRHSPAPFVAVVVALLAAAGLGAYLYDISRRPEGAQGIEPDTSESRGEPEQLAPPAPDAPPAAPAEPTEPAAPATTATPRSRPAASVEQPALAAPAGFNASAVNARDIRRTPFTPAAGVPEGRGEPNARSEPDTPSAAAVPPATDVSGTWTLDTRIEASSYRDYEGLQLGYRLELRQDGSRVTGTGVKTTESGRQLGSAAQTPMLIQGTISGERLTLTFVERGLSRTTHGKMILDVTDDGVLRGRFSSTAAQSNGLVEARRRAGEG
jgi:cytoskeletal protein RodZ